MYPGSGMRMYSGGMGGLGYYPPAPAAASGYPDYPQQQQQQQPFNQFNYQQQVQNDFFAESLGSVFYIKSIIKH